MKERKREDKKYEAKNGYEQDKIFHNIGDNDSEHDNEIVLYELIDNKSGVKQLKRK